MGPGLLVSAGLLLLFVGVLSLVRPLRFLGIADRGRAAAVLGLGLALFVIGATLPAPIEHASGGASHLDDLLPAYNFHEVHTISVHAANDRVFRAIHSVTAGEIRFFRLLTWFRSPRLGKGRETILSAPPDKPILDVALRSGFRLLAEEPQRELVFGTLLGPPVAIANLNPEAFARFDSPGYCKIAMNFRLREEGNGSILLSTETRVLATDASARRLFAVYWRIIHPGSAFIRHFWLEAIKERAER